MHTFLVLAFLCFAAAALIAVLSERTDIAVALTAAGLALSIAYPVFNT